MANLVTLNAIFFDGANFVYKANITITTDDTVILTADPDIGGNIDPIRFDLRNSAGTVLTATNGLLPDGPQTKFGAGTTATNSFFIDPSDFIGPGETYADNAAFEADLVRIQTTNSVPGSTTGFNDTTPAVHACFQKGTHILTPEGEKAVELLRKGDLVISAKTGKSVPIKAMLGFLGTQTNCPLYCLPKDALGENKPTQDLFLSHRHRVSFDGQLRHMVCLAELGKSVPVLKERIEYYHIELADCFDTVIAEGLEVETFIDPRVVAHDWECTGACCTYIPIGPQPTSTLVEPLAITA